MANKKAGKGEVVDGIQQAALELFSEKGYEQSSLRDIAKAAGVTVGALQYYYESKDALFSACLDEFDRKLAVLRSEVSAKLATAEGIAAKVAVAVRETFRFSYRERSMLRMRMRGVFLAGSIDEKRRNHLQTPFINTFGDYFASVAKIDPIEGRFFVRSVQHLVVRYSLTKLEELRELVSAPADASEEQVLQMVEDALVQFFGKFPLPN